MLENKDIEKIIKAMENVFPTKTDFSDFQDEMRKDFSDLQISVDAYAKKADTYFQEMLMLSNKVNRIEKWMHEIAEKVGVELKY